MKRRIPWIAAAVALACLSGWLWYWHARGGRAARLAESPDPRDRLEAVRELRGTSGGLARRTLSRLPDDPDPQVARLAVRALGERPEPESRLRLEEILSGSRRREVRAEAAIALGRHPGTDLRLLTGTLGTDPDPAVRAAAAAGLEARGDLAAVPALLERLERDPDVQVRRSSFVALRRTVKVRFRYDPEGPVEQRHRQVATIRSILRKFGGL